MRMKKATALLCATVLAIGSLAGCGASSGATTAEGDGSSESGAKEQTLKVAAFEGGYGADMWDEVCKAFETSHPGVTVELTVDKKIEDKISPSMKSGDYPDVVHCATGREAALTETLTKEKALLDISDVLDMKVPGEEITVREKILPGFLDTYGTMPYRDGKTYYAPMFYSPCGMFYDANLLKTKGWEVPKTWEEMWQLGDKAKAEGIALFTYPTTGYFDAFTYALLVSVGGTDLFNKVVSYDKDVWNTDEAKEALDIIAKLGTYTEKTTVANANNDNFTKNQQLILDDKAIFCPNGTWLPGEMKDAPRADGFKWGMTALPALKDGEAGASYTFFEQMWIPKEAKNAELAKEFVAYMYSDEAAQIFAKAGAIQPIQGIVDSLTGDNKLFYSIYENGATAVLGGFATTKPVEGVNMTDTLFGTVNSIVSGDKNVDEWRAAIIEANNKLNAALE